MLRAAVAELLQKRWSPEQVAHELRVLFAGQPRRWLCTESIYQAIYDPAVEVTRPARRRRRRRRLLGIQRRGRLTSMRMLDERPAEALDRVQGGHWEGDLIMGPQNRSAIGTLVERTTRFVILLHLPDGIATADAVRQAVTSAQAPACLRTARAGAQHRVCLSARGPPRGRRRVGRPLITGSLRPRRCRRGCCRGLDAA